MTRYRKRPVEVDAIRWTGVNTNDVLRFGVAKIVYSESMVAVPVLGPHLEVWTLHGPTAAMEGDWIVRGPNGDFWPVRSDIFEESYEAIGG